MVEEGPLVITRHNALLDKPLPWAAPSTVRTDQLDDLLALFTAYQGRQQPGQQPAWHVVNGVNSSSQHDGDVGHDALSTAVDQHDVDQHNVDLVKSWTGAHMARALLSEEHLSFQYTHSRDVWRNVWRIPTTLGGPQWPPRPPPPPVTVLDSDAHALARGCIFCTENLTDTLDGWLLSRWHTNAPVYDALFVHDVHAVLEVRVCVDCSCASALLYVCVSGYYAHHVCCPPPHLSASHALISTHHCFPYTCVPHPTHVPVTLHFIPFMFLSPSISPLPFVLTFHFTSQYPENLPLLSQSSFSSQGPSPLITATIMVNETALFGLSAAVNAVNTALLRLVVGDVNATIGMVNHPLPLVKNEAAVTLSHIAGMYVRGGGVCGGGEEWGRKGDCCMCMPGFLCVYVCVRVCVYALVLVCVFWVLCVLFMCTYIQCCLYCNIHGHLKSIPHTSTTHTYINPHHTQVNCCS